MKTVVLGIIMTLLLRAGPIAAECLYHGVPYSEGARVCMHRTMYMCRGERWVKTAERCWDRYLTEVSRNRGPANSFCLAELAAIQHTDNLAKHEQERPEIH